MSKMRFGLILAILAMAIVSGACVPSVPQPTPTPGTIHPPVISSLTSAQTQVLPSSIVEIRCVASDPDGYDMSYEWSATGGRFSGVGPTVSWIAPEAYGTYDITVTVKDSRGGVTQGSITLSVVANRPPQIQSLVADPTTVLPQGKSTITCIATSPNGYVLNYNWTASDGDITGVGATVTWVAPDREGAFTITVTVGDGKGGQDVRYVSVTVGLPEKTVTLTLLPNESGTVLSSGDKDNSMLIAGDNDKDVGYRAFFSFDISSLRGTDVSDAELNFTTGTQVGNPFSKEIYGLGGLHLYRVSGEQGQLPDYDTEQIALANTGASSVMWEPPVVVNVTAEVKSPLLTPAFNIHTQFEASFLNKSNGDHVSDYIKWSGVTLTVTYVER